MMLNYLIHPFSALLKCINVSKFKRYCDKVGEDFRLYGSCIFNGSGAMVVGDSVMIKSPSHKKVEFHISEHASVSIGSGTFINRGTHISCSESIFIGRNCLIGDDCVLIDNDYHAVGDGRAKSAPIILEDGVWLAIKVIVLRGVTIGEGSIIGAGSVVTRSIPPYTFAAGAPARVIRKVDAQQLR